MCPGLKSLDKMCTFVDKTVDKWQKKHKICV